MILSEANREADDFIQIGKNLLLITSEQAILKKTKREKSKLILSTVLGLVLIVSLVVFLLWINWPRIKILKEFLNLLILTGLVGWVMYFLIARIREVISECKDYLITVCNGDVVVNGSTFSDRSHAEITIRKYVGWQGFGVAYAVRLTERKKKQDT